ncbi:MAG: ketosamine-3-kinase [Chitinophagaceae bacterium]
MKKQITPEILQLLKNKTGTSSLQLQPVGGGCINECFCITSTTKRFFLKINSLSDYPGMFETEKKGLEMLGIHQLIRVPAVVDCFENEDRQFLILEWIETGILTDGFWKKFGEQLASLHKVSNDFFGLADNNFIGSLRQLNTPSQSWADFFIECRIVPQLTLAKEKRLLPSSLSKNFEKLFTRLPEIFETSQAALLHGDLWSGNFMCSENSDPVLIDPAVYFGHRSMDLAMTTLFGGFDDFFYEAYHYHFPFPANYKEQWDVCNLYPLLIHLNLFGSGYLSQIEAILKRFQ